MKSETNILFYLYHREIGSLWTFDKIIVLCRPPCYDCIKSNSLSL